MSFLWAGYLLTWGAVGWYAWRVERRVRDADRRLDRLSDDETTTGSP